MYKNCFLGVLVGALLILALILVSKAVGPLVGAEKSSLSYNGMGDLQSFEAQLSNAGSGAQGMIRSYSGMGDLHLLDAQSFISVNPGMGDLQRFEAQPLPAQ